MSTIERRLSQLESVDKSTPSRDGTARLLSELKTTYARIGNADVSEGWLEHQSNKTALAVAMHSPLPLPGFLSRRLDSLSSQDSTLGKLASSILEVSR